MGSCSELQCIQSETAPFLNFALVLARIHLFLLSDDSPLEAHFISNHKYTFKAAFVPGWLVHIVSILALVHPSPLCISPLHEPASAVTFQCV